ADAVPGTVASHGALNHWTAEGRWNPAGFVSVEIDRGWGRAACGPPGRAGRSAASVVKHRPGLDSTRAPADAAGRAFPADNPGLPCGSPDGPRLATAALRSPRRPYDRPSRPGAPCPTPLTCSPGLWTFTAPATWPGPSRSTGRSSACGPATRRR